MVGTVEDSKGLTCDRSARRSLERGVTVDPEDEMEEGEIVEEEEENGAKLGLLEVSDEHQQERKRRDEWSPESLPPQKEGTVHEVGFVDDVLRRRKTHNDIEVDNGCGRRDVSKKRSDSRKRDAPMIASDDSREESPADRWMYKRRRLEERCGIDESSHKRRRSRSSERHHRTEKRLRHESRRNHHAMEETITQSLLFEDEPESLEQVNSHEPISNRKASPKREFHEPKTESRFHKNNQESASNKHTQKSLSKSRESARDSVDRRDLKLKLRSEEQLSFEEDWAKKVRSRSKEGSKHGDREERHISQTRESPYDKDANTRNRIYDKTLRSRSREGQRYHSDMDDRRARSRSRERSSAYERGERGARSRSRESWRHHSYGQERKARSRSKERVRDRDDSKQRERKLIEFSGSRDSERSREGFSYPSNDRMRKERSTSRETVRHRRDSRDRSKRSPSRDRQHLSRHRHDSLERRRRSRSRESLRGHREYETSYDRYGNHAMRDERNLRNDYYARSEKDPSVSQHRKDEQIARDDEIQEDYQERVASQLAAQEEDDAERIKEESRRRRQAIIEKYKQQQQVKEAGKPKILNSDSITEGSPELGDGGTAVGNSMFSLDKGPLHNGSNLDRKQSGLGGLGEGTPKSDKSDEKFCDDIFGDSPAGGRRVGKGDGLALDVSGLTDNWDDAEGYYSYRIGEVLDARYEVLSSHGKGVFSTVVRARDLKVVRSDFDEVAIKLIRNNDLMFKAGQRELVILKKLSGADPENRRHCVRFLSSFEYRKHLCLVFEPLHMNLREVLKKFGRNIGINLNAVRAYAKQLFIALKHLKNCGVLHCDIKPDNMLVNEAKNVLKVCDFGSAMFAGENEITPYLVSRFYRAPEIILGLPYDHALDIWSVGCCLYEFYTGKVLFPGPTNNDMLKLHMELKGAFPRKMLKKASFTSQHFDQDYSFCAFEEDPVTKKTVKRIVANVKPRDIGALLQGSGSVDEEPKMLANFKDLLDKIFILDPDRRLTVSQALNHSFITGK